MMHRPTLAKGNTVTLAVPDIEVVDVIRLELLIEGCSVPFSYNLEEKDGFSAVGEHLVVQQGDQTIMFPLSRILYRSVRPAKMNKVRPSGSI